MQTYKGTWSDGPQADAEVCCPECGETLSVHDTLYVHALCSEVVGCSQCIGAHSALEWFDDACGQRLQ